jgi:hypothetical protein
MFHDPPSASVDFEHVLKNFPKHFKTTQRENVQNVKAHNFAVDWHLKFEEILGENAIECVMILFIGAEFLANFACRSCSIPCIKPLSAFANVVEGNLLKNFGIQGSGHFSFNFWQKLSLKKAKRNCQESWRSRARRRPRDATSAAPYPARARTPRHTVH